MVQHNLHTPLLKTDLFHQGFMLKKNLMIFKALRSESDYRKKLCSPYPVTDRERKREAERERERGGGAGEREREREGEKERAIDESTRER